MLTISRTRGLGIGAQADVPRLVAGLEHARPLAERLVASLLDQSDAVPAMPEQDLDRRRVEAHVEELLADPDDLAQVPFLPDVDVDADDAVGEVAVVVDQPVLLAPHPTTMKQNGEFSWNALSENAKDRCVSADSQVVEVLKDDELAELDLLQGGDDVVDVVEVDLQALGHHRVGGVGLPVRRGLAEALATNGTLPSPANSAPYFQAPPTVLVCVCSMR